MEYSARVRAVGNCLVALACLHEVVYVAMYLFEILREGESAESSRQALTYS